MIDRNLSQPQPPTALITYDDQQLLRLTELLRRRGLRVPEDVSLVALKDIGFTEASVTTITRMVAPTKAMANFAMQWVSDNLATNKLAKPTIERLHAELVVGESSAPPPASSRSKSSQ